MPALVTPSPAAYLDRLAHIATSALVRILEDPDTPAALAQRAAAALLRYVTSERRRADARERAALASANQRAGGPEYPAADADARINATAADEDAISLAGLNAYQRELLQECLRQLVEYGGPLPERDEHMLERERHAAENGAQAAPRSSGARAGVVAGAPDPPPSDPRAAAA